MTTRQELLTQWQERLADAEEACAAAPTWAEHIRVKLYRFLLAMYGHTQWPGPKDDVDNSQLRTATSKLIVAEPQQDVLTGKEPRTRAEILKGLQNLKGLGEELAPAGPLADGLLPDSPVAVASFNRESAASAAIRKLQRAGFSPRIAHRGGLYQIFVGAAHSAEAIEWLRANLPPARSGNTISRQRPSRPILLCGAMFFGIIGGLLAAMLIQLLLVDFAHVPSYQLSTHEFFLPLFFFSIIFLAASALLFRTWSESLPARSFGLPSFITLLLCTGVVHALSGFVLMLYLAIFLWFPPNPTDAEAWLVLDPQYLNWIGAAAVCLSLLGLQMLWIWWKWRRQMGNELAAVTRAAQQTR